MICKKVMDAVKPKCGKNEYICPYKNLHVTIQRIIVSDAIK